MLEYVTINYKVHAWILHASMAQCSSLTNTNLLHDNPHSFHIGNACINQGVLQQLKYGAMLKVMFHDIMV
jgi:hypothetical protein